jgi:hypothetical protein
VTALSCDGLVLFWFLSYYVQPECPIRSNDVKSINVLLKERWSCRVLSKSLHVSARQRMVLRLGQCAHALRFSPLEVARVGVGLGLGLGLGLGIGLGLGLGLGFRVRSVLGLG